MKVDHLSGRCPKKNQPFVSLSSIFYLLSSFLYPLLLVKIKKMSRENKTFHVLMKQRKL